MSRRVPSFARACASRWRIIGLPATSSPGEGFDDGNSTSGRGCVTLGTAGRLLGHIFIHNGDNSAFVAERE